jgi:hypothetical protein
MTNAKFPIHPDLISDLAPDCRRVLREAYMVIQARMNPPAQTTVHDGKGGFRQATPAEARTIQDAERGSVGDAVTEYRRIAALWGVEVN